MFGTRPTVHPGSTDHAWSDIREHRAAGMLQRRVDCSLTPLRSRIVSKRRVTVRTLETLVR